MEAGSAEGIDAAVIDSHQHAWDLTRSSYSWLASPGLESIRRSITIDEGDVHLDEAGIDGTILVQADDTDADTDLMLDLALQSNRVVGVVGWGALDRPDELEERLSAISSPLLVGVRALIHDSPDPDWILRSDVGEGLRVLQRHGLSFDFVAVLPRHLENAITIAERHPDLRMVIDHLAKPPIGLADREPWWTLIARAAENPLVTAKLSGLYSATGDLGSWTADQLGPFIDRGLEVFGADRLMYGSDWPFSIIAGDDSRTWPAVEQHLAGLGGAERSAILGGNARRFYQLDPARVQAAVDAHRPSSVPSGWTTPSASVTPHRPPAASP